MCIGLRRRFRVARTFAWPPEARKSWLAIRFSQSSRASAFRVQIDAQLALTTGAAEGTQNEGTQDTP